MTEIKTETNRTITTLSNASKRVNCALDIIDKRISCIKIGQCTEEDKIVYLELYRELTKAREYMKILL